MVIDAELTRHKICQWQFSATEVLAVFRNEQVGAVIGVIVEMVHNALGAIIWVRSFSAFSLS